MHVHRAHRFQRHRSGNDRARSDHAFGIPFTQGIPRFFRTMLALAARAKREEHKNMMLQMADHWMQTAQKLERADTYRCVPSGGGARAWRRRRPRKATLGKSRRRTISRVRVDDILLAGPRHDTKSRTGIERVCHGLFRSRLPAPHRPQRSAAEIFVAESVNPMPPSGDI